MTIESTLSFHTISQNMGTVVGFGPKSNIIVYFKDTIRNNYIECHVMFNKPLLALFRLWGWGGRGAEIAHANFSFRELP